MRKIAKDSADWTYDSMQNINTPRGSIFRQVRGFLSTKRGNKTDSSIDELSAQNPAKLSKRQRAGFTMIELIFSIVIVGLVILSIPLIVRQSNLNAITSQNVIGYYNALTLMETIKSKPWDTNNVADFVTSGEYYILNTNEDSCKNIPVTVKLSIKDANGNTQQKEVNITEQILTKRGLSIANKRRMCDREGRSATTIPSSPSSIKQSINDFNGYEAIVYSDTDTKQQIFKLRVTIDYVVADFGTGKNAGSILAANGTSDVKRIRVTLIRMVNNQEIDADGEAVLTYYAANIGSDIPLIKDNVAN